MSDWSSDVCSSDLVKGLWAIGDVTAPPWLAHKASHEGIIAAEAIAQELGNKDAPPHSMAAPNIPGCTSCRPQIGHVGLTEARDDRKSVVLVKTEYVQLSTCGRGLIK